MSRVVATGSDLIVCDPETLTTAEDFHNFFTKIRGGGKVLFGAIDLSNKNLGDLALNLVEAVGNNTNVSRLILDKNNIRLDTILQIAERLKTNTALTHLSLRGNNISDAVVASLIAMLEINKTLVEIKVGYTSSQEIRDALDEKLAENAKACGRSTGRTIRTDIEGAKRPRAVGRTPPNTDFVRDLGEGEELGAGGSFVVDATEEEIEKFKEATSWVERAPAPRTSVAVLHAHTESAFTSLGRR
jgi:hypothetical protein